jgi:hypothetical protein
MTLTELRDTLSSVSGAVPVPMPDATAFERRVTHTRRRRTAVRAVGAVAAVGLVAGGSAFALSLGGGPDASEPAQDTATHDTATQGPHWVPVVVDGRFHVVDGTVLGPEGPAAASIVGTTPHGVVVITEDGTLARIDELSSELQPLVPGKVRAAYLAGDAVVYENRQGLIRWRGIEPTVVATDSAQTDEGRLMAANDDRFVIADGAGGALVSHDPDGLHELPVQDVTTVHRVETGGDVIAVQTADGVVFFSPDGVPTGSSDYDLDRLGTLAPDGHSFALQTDSRRSVEMLDPVTLESSPVKGPAGTVVDLGWSPDGDLLVVVHEDTARTLWRCSPDGTDCSAKVDDPTGTLRLR